MRNVRIKHDFITNKIRVSTAAIWREQIFYDSLHKYWLIETWCFSDDPKQKSFQVIHGTPGYLYDWVRWEARKVHGYIVENLKKKLRSQRKDAPVKIAAKSDRGAYGG